jgi:hypothetical protein
MDKNRILELAIEELERQRAAVLAEIESIRSQLNEKASRPAGKVKAAIRTARKGPKSAAARKAQSQRMKQYWAVRKAKAAKLKAVKKAPPAKAKTRAKTEAEKKALSLKMKEVWKKRKAEAAKKKS